jgi:5'(3')-deoxyribonucleotidase
MKKVSEVGSAIQKETNKYVPALLSQDKKFANAFSTVVSVLVCADREVEVNETIQALNFIQNDPILKEKGLVVYGIESYKNIIGELSSVFNNEPEFLVQKARIIQDSIPGLNDEYKSYIRTLCNKLAGSTANREEVLVRNELIAAIG